VELLAAPSDDTAGLVDVRIALAPGVGLGVDDCVKSTYGNSLEVIKERLVPVSQGAQMAFSSSLYRKLRLGFDDSACFFLPVCVSWIVWLSTAAGHSKEKLTGCCPNSYSRNLNEVLDNSVNLPYHRTSC